MVHLCSLCFGLLFFDLSFCSLYTVITAWMLLDGRGKFFLEGISSHIGIFVILFVKTNAVDFYMVQGDFDCVVQKSN